MKKLIFFMLMMVSMVLVGTLATSCRSHRNKVDIDTTIVSHDSTVVSNMTSADSLYKQIMLDRHMAEVDRTLSNIKPEVLRGLINVVCSNLHYHMITKENVYNEYIAHRPFYDGINEKYNTIDPPSHDTIPIGEYRAFPSSEVGEE